jgi:hypothetical protein
VGGGGYVKVKHVLCIVCSNQKVTTEVISTNFSLDDAFRKSRANPSLNKIICQYIDEQDWLRQVSKLL